MSEHAPDLQPGQILARGVCRFLIDEGLAPVVEFSPARGLRTDVTALTTNGEIWVVECKSSVADFRSDAKWEGYLDWCDRFFFAAPADLPDDLLPENHGLIIADGYGAEILRPAHKRPLAAARRKALTQRIARVAALRLRAAADPGVEALLSAEDLTEDRLTGRWLQRPPSPNANRTNHRQRDRLFRTSSHQPAPDR